MASSHAPELYFHILNDYPAIDNHAHPLLTAENRNRLAFEGLTSEAEGPALEDAVYSLPHSTAQRDLARLYGLPRHTSWDDIKKHRAARPYDDLCRLCFEKANIQCILIDDGLSGSKDMAEEYRWHDRYTSSPTRRIVRVEVIAEDILTELFEAGQLDSDPGIEGLTRFAVLLHTRLKANADNPNVAGFKSIVCYRTGLDVDIASNVPAEIEALRGAYGQFRLRTNVPVRLENKPLNDFVVRMTLEIAAEHNKPVQFHTGLGDADITLTRANPAHLQPLIAKYPRAKFVLLHASYPYTREAGYLTAVYKNVYLDIGEVFPAVSMQGQKALIRQALEIVPTNKLMWSSDGHWWPETYYLGSHQARRALASVLYEAVREDDLTPEEAARVAKDILFHTANRVYLLGLEARYTYVD
ncbi:amidohydrolase-domain-containing protein [Lactarius hatsudake]|nr:amidohydrolase-domain-containing protein [Lactarius hatsudake]